MRDVRPVAVRLWAALALGTVVLFGSGSALAAEPEWASVADEKLVFALTHDEGGEFPALRTPKFNLGKLRVKNVNLLTQTATVIMLDLSWSMALRGSFQAAKKVALALNNLIQTQFPKDSLYIVGFSAYARATAEAAATREAESSMAGAFAALTAEQQREATARALAMPKFSLYRPPSRSSIRSPGLS